MSYPGVPFVGPDVGGFWTLERLGCQSAVSVLMLDVAAPGTGFLRRDDGLNTGNLLAGAPHPNSPAGRHFDAATRQSGARSQSSPITEDQLTKIFPKAELGYLKRTAAELNVDLSKYGLDTILRKAHFFAQIRQEGGPGMEATVESLDYRPEGLKANFRYFRKHGDEALADGRQIDPVTKKTTRPADQETIADHAYANRAGNKDAASGDGWNFRGRGLIQITGRLNYAQITQQYSKLYADGTVDFEKSPDLVAQFPYSVRSAVCFWIQNHLDALAERGGTDSDVDRITKVVNRATHSYSDRRANFKMAYKAFKYNAFR